MNCFISWLFLGFVLVWGMRIIRSCWGFVRSRKRGILFVRLVSSVVFRIVEFRRKVVFWGYGFFVYICSRVFTVTFIVVDALVFLVSVRMLKWLREEEKLVKVKIIFFWFIWSWLKVVVGRLFIRRCSYWGF